MANADRLIEILNEAEARSAGAERERFLAKACQGDPELKEQVVSLLQSHESAGDFLKNTFISATVLVTEKLGDVIGRYKLLEKLGEGGCGVVYVAEQTEPVRRRVALKVLKLGMDTKQVVTRFEAERQALAMMDHPNIAKVFDAGATDAPLPASGHPLPSSLPRPSSLATPSGRPYFVMELVRGIRITDYCDQNNLVTKERIDLFIEVCQAIQHAHQKGIIHRDIKPSNILVTLHDGVPVPKVIDFGIAKATEGRLTEATVYTQLLHFIGTPAYMSPEQAEMSGLDVDTRSDIYSLGVLLYELLTGKTPFDGQKLMASGIDAMRKTIREKDPERPSTKLSQALVAAEVTRRTFGEAESSASSRRRLQDTIILLKGDLDWIVMKCLEKDRTRRYETANGLAADLQRHLTNEPVVARPPTPLYRFQKMVRRNKLAFAATGAVATALVLGLAVAAMGLVRERVARRSAQRNLYSSDMNLAVQAWEANDFRRARPLLEAHRPRRDREDLRGFEWRLLARLCEETSLYVFPGADPTDDAIGSRDMAVAFSPDSRTLAIARNDGTIRLHDSVTREFRHEFKAHNSQISELKFSPDGKILASASGGIFFGDTMGAVKLWDVASRQLLGSPLGAHFRGVKSIAFAPDGKTLASVGNDNTGKLWAVPTGELLATLEGHEDVVWCVASAPDGRTLATASNDGTVKLWESRTGLELTTLWRHRSAILSVAFSPDGETLAAGTLDARVALWNVATGSLKVTLQQKSGVSSLAFSPDGKLLAGGEHSAVVLWDVATHEEVDTLKGLPSFTASLAFSRDGQWLAVACAAGAARLWPGPPHPNVPVLQAHNDGVMAVAFSRDGTLLATGSGHFHQPKRPCEIKLWNAGTGRLLKSMPGHDGDVTSLVFSLDDKTLISCSYDATVRLWDVESGRELNRFEGPMQEIGCVTLSPDGKTVAVSHGKENTLRLWDFVSHQELPPLVASGPVTRVAFTPDGRSLVSAHIDGWVQVWDTRTWRKTIPMKGEGVLAALAISPDGKTIATGGVRRIIQLWDLTTGLKLAALSGHHEVVVCLAFSPDGRTLASSSVEGIVKLWSILTLQEVATLRAHKTAVDSLAFSPDGKTLATASRDKTVRLWRARSFAELDAIENAKPLLEASGK